jgi:hypothetical protein
MGFSNGLVSMGTIFPAGIKYSAYSNGNVYGATANKGKSNMVQIGGSVPALFTATNKHGAAADTGIGNVGIVQNNIISPPIHG